MHYSSSFPDHHSYPKCLNEQDRSINFCLLTLKSLNNCLRLVVGKTKTFVTIFTFLRCGVFMSYEETCDWAKPSIFLQMVNVCKPFVDDHMIFVLAHE